jgi:hypothetical protein
MAQVTLYLPTEVERLLRAEAKRRKQSVSAYMAELAREKLSPAAWPKSFLDAAGSWEGSFPEIPDPPPEPVEVK